LRLIRAQVRERASRAANDLGVLLEKTGDVQGAESAYKEALLLEGGNLCSELNREGLRLRSRVPGAAQAFIKRAATLSSDPGFFETFDANVARYGMLSNQEPDALLPAIMRDCEMGSKPPANTIRLLEKWLEATRSLPPGNSPSIAKASRPADTAPDAMLSQALAMWLDGQTEKAEKRLWLIVRNRPNNLSAWALLAEVLMSRDRVKEVNEVVLPAMHAVLAKTENADGTLVEMTQGCLLMRTVPSNPAAARACFERALTIKPTLTSACDQLLRVDRILGNAADLEKDALRILAGNPDHSDANAIMGSLRLGQKRMAEAEKFLRQSIKTQPTACALNDLAELLRQQNKLPEAEQKARLAIRLAPVFYPAWDTLGNILVESGRLDEAYGPLRCALALSSNDPRLYLTLTRLHIKSGLLREASSVLDQSQPMISQTAPSVRDEYAKLRQQLITRSDDPRN
jgi:tetratricopeptide (TPR) repeat protein